MGTVPQEQGTSRQAQAVVRGDVAVLPRHRLQARQHGVALLPRRHQDGRPGRPLGQRLGCGLLDGAAVCVGCRRGPLVEPLRGGLLHCACACARVRARAGGASTGGASLGGGEGGQQGLVVAKVVIHRCGARRGKMKLILYTLRDVEYGARRSHHPWRVIS